ncbi:MAG: BMP family ABC transporter substrate-binding protein, partial [Zoogloeaceae bacterium]|nr:BMP family ABC transporter substrate-binding protein [Zoogloeaceae bacterium]
MPARKFFHLFSLWCLAALFACGLTACRHEDAARSASPAQEARGDFKIGVLYLSDPRYDPHGFSAAHYQGIEAMQKTLALNPEQILARFDVSAQNPDIIEFSMRELIAQGAKLIIATSAQQQEKALELAPEFPQVLFACLHGRPSTLPNVIRFFGRVYEAHYLAGVAAGLNTKNGKIGYLAALGKESAEVTSGVTAFAMGVASVNPKARIHLRTLGRWYDPVGETLVTRALLAEGCDLIVQHSDTATPVREAEEAGVMAIGYNTDMRQAAPRAVLTSIVWHWEVYYTRLVHALLTGQ